MNFRKFIKFSNEMMKISNEIAKFPELEDKISYSDDEQDSINFPLNLDLQQNSNLLLR